ncbi:uncharacterized protein TNCV_3956841 [Trichonephila clavipes]|nr:uncharacterized protein TNCV_3956841 [Trichonephila clavipes]
MGYSPLRQSLHEAPKPRLPDSIDHPIAVMPPSRMQNTTLAMPLIEDLSRYGIEDCSYSPVAQKSNAYSTPVIFVGSKTRTEPLCFLVEPERKKLQFEALVLIIIKKC